MAMTASIYIYDKHEHVIWQAAHGNIFNCDDAMRDKILWYAASLDPFDFIACGVATRDDAIKAIEDEYD